MTDRSSRKIYEKSMRNKSIAMNSPSHVEIGIEDSVSRRKSLRKKVISPCSMSRMKSPSGKMVVKDTISPSTS